MADIRINALATTATTPASDDYLALDGTAQGTRKILATNIANNVTDVILGASGPSVKSTLSARAPRQGLVFDGTAGATVTGPVFGSNDFTVAFWVNPSSLTSSRSLAGSNITSTASFYVALTTGFVVVSNQNVADIGASNVGLVANKMGLVVYTRSGTTGTFYVNGVAAGTFTDATNYTGNWTHIGARYAGIELFSGYIYPLLENRALSASEVVALYESGAPSGADYNNAGSTDIKPSTGTYAYWFGTGSISSATASSFTIAAGASALAVRNVTLNFSGVTGRRYRATIVASGLNSAASFGPQVLTSNATAGNVTNGTNVIEFTATNTATGYFAFSDIASTAGGSISISSIQALGLLLAPDAAQAGGGYVWNDQSGNLAQIVLPSSGVQWNLPSVATNRIRGTTSTNGNQQLLGASVLLPAECQITHVRARARSGTPTITIGTASGGAQIVASVALSTTWLNCTIALTGGIVSSADDIWIGSNSTDVVETDIAFQPLDF